MAEVSSSHAGSILYCNCGLKLFSMNEDLHHLKPSPDMATSASSAITVAEAAGLLFVTNTNEGDYLEKRQLSVFCWAELRK